MEHVGRHGRAGFAVARFVVAGFVVAGFVVARFVVACLVALAVVVGGPGAARAEKTTTTKATTTTTKTTTPAAPKTTTPAGAASRASGTARAPVVAPAPLGVTYAAWRGELGDAPAKLATFREIGFRIVSFVPTYAYEGRDKIDLTSGPDAAELTRAVVAARAAGFSVVIKPHLDPLAYRPGFDRYHTENPSWRVNCPWRGFFDVDPMSDDYRVGVVFGALRMLKAAFDGAGGGGPGRASAPVRLELGVELMDSVVHGPERWEQLLVEAKDERRRLGLDGKVLLSHNFSHHFEILDDFVGRMNPVQRQALARYIRGLDALSLSQYMDLTAAMPKNERGHRLPTVDEVADALRLHDQLFRRDILQATLGLTPAEIPPLHIGEFGIGRGGLLHPNLWDGAASPAEEKDLAREIARGHEGLLRYLAQPEGRTVRSAVLWVTGSHYDVFGWGDSRNAVPEAAAVIKAGLHPHSPSH